MRLVSWLCAVLSGLCLSGCGDRQASIDAALTLAEKLYPGRLELFDSHLQQGNYAVTLAVKGDPFTRIRFDIDRDPSQCRVRSHCEQRLRSAYAEGIAAGAKLKALNAAFPACGVTMLAVHEARVTSAFRTIIELDLDPANQQPGLDRLAPCVSAFRAALPLDVVPEQRRLSLRILTPGRNGPAIARSPVTFESRLDDARQDEPSYMISIAPEARTTSAGDLRIYANFLSRPELRDQLAEAARKALAADGQGGHVPTMTFLNETRLDPSRLDVIRTYILACSIYEPGKGPCREDIAVRLHHDLASGKSSDAQVFHDVRNQHGRLDLPPLPGR